MSGCLAIHLGLPVTWASGSMLQKSGVAKAGLAAAATPLISSRYNGDILPQGTLSHDCNLGDTPQGRFKFRAAAPPGPPALVAFWFLGRAPGTHPWGQHSGSGSVPPRGPHRTRPVCPRWAHLHSGLPPPSRGPRLQHRSQSRRRGSTHGRKCVRSPHSRATYFKASGRRQGCQALPTPNRACPPATVLGSSRSDSGLVSFCFSTPRDLQQTGNTRGPAGRCFRMR
ncbi:hypothetical protein NDU88_003715 [Pleurodeles waltl]|uniref:Uncharacterized protein n=1 Tax=Pleurodeles waltl TaxID=8319 RepID=A0AAV7SGS1_PLEWA|nr:hypothetical protein NDU88_003715 [Pleurodeles waltl]